MKELLVMQWRFDQRQVRAVRLLQHKRFRAAYDLCCVRAAARSIKRPWIVDRDQRLSPDEQK
jgi:hypothetical protein